MNIVGLDQVTSNATETGESEKSTMGKDDFLNLLVTQLQNQDPLNPADSTEFTAQLATFSSLEELQNIGSTLETLSTSQMIQIYAKAVDFIGKEVQAVGDEVYLEAGGSVDLEFDLSRDAAEVYVNIYDQDGEFVQNIDAGSMDTGVQSVQWDGMDQYGNPAGQGSYTFEVAAVDADGNSVPTTTYAQGIVQGVYYKNGMAYLVTADQEFEMGEVVQVYNNE
jgi:flagellar basal-body rod modification protein FlgD